MKRCLVLLAMFSQALRAELPAMTADQIIAKHVAARGGMTRLAAIQSIRTTGKVVIVWAGEAARPMEFTLTTEQKRGAFRSDTTIQGMTKTSAFDGTAGWTINPFAGTGAGKDDAEPMSPQELRQMALEADLDGPLVEYAAKGHKVELLGEDSVDGVAAYKLRVALKSGDELTAFIDAQSFLEIKQASKSVVGGTEVKNEAVFGDFKAVNGVMIPFSLEIKTEGQTQSLRITFDTVDVNTPIDDTRFKMPPKKAPADAPRGGS